MEFTIYIGIDLFDLDKSSQAKVEKAIQEYCVEHDDELLIGTIDDLIDEGYIEVNPEIGRWFMEDCKNNHLGCINAYFYSSNTLKRILKVKKDV